jgi:hypothetical protein
MGGNRLRTGVEAMLAAERNSFADRINEQRLLSPRVASGLSSALLVLMLCVHFEQADSVVRQVCPARSAPGGRPKRRLNARLKELSDW